MMIIKTFKTTIFNIIRSFTFWLIIGVLSIVSIHSTIEGFYLGDNNPAFVLDYQSYVQCFVNSLAAKLLMYAFPVFTVVTAVLILNRDYNDKFFEIEKAANIKPSVYLLGRLLAIFTINFIVLLLTNLLCMYWYVFTRGGVDGLTSWQVISETFVRVLRVDIFIGIPNLLFYIGITYFIGTVFKNGLPAAITSIAYIIAFYAGNLMFRNQISEDYFNYYSPIPRKLRYYFHYYDTEWFEDTLKRFNTSLKDVMFCAMFLIGCMILCSLISYINIRRRNL